MDNINICNFIKEVKRSDVQVINYVYETNEKVYTKWRYSTYCRVYYVIGGKGVFKTNYGEYQIEEGDVFIELPAQHYYIENVQDLKFAYLSFIGTSAIDTLDNLKISATNCVYKNLKGIGKIWVDNLSLNESLIGLASQGVLHLTLAEIGKINAVKKSTLNTDKSVAHKIKLFIDDNFTNQHLNLDLISKELSYNPKYISRAFVKNMKTTISEYINSLRIKYAYSLIKRNVSSIKDISLACGFQDPLYFSKVYKGIIGESPSQTINKIKKG
jgi:AraC-like DNA-binding protein/quercetin dioxygenase-like cupin family protein